MAGKGTVLVAMSGGVDSSVTALLLKRAGYDCLGVTMQLYDSVRIDCTLPTCCSVDDIEDARKVAAGLGIPFDVIDFRDVFEDHVIKRFVDEYRAGRTPNPCIDCNNTMKFGALWEAARKLGCDHLATGHYAQVDVRDDGVHLRQAVDRSKDQSYVLAGVSRDVLQHVLLPLGDRTKQQVRELAADAGLAIARKGESQDICFVPDGDHVGFIERYTQTREPDGDIVNTAGDVLGRHHGLSAYTIGQRQGLGVAVGHPLYVCRKDIDANRLVVGEHDDLACCGITASGWNWIREPRCASFAAMVKVRYRQAQHGCTVELSDDPSRVRIRFDAPEYGVSPGQAAVVYDNDEVLGGGTIEWTEAYHAVP